jgi:hypothetical protein
MQGQAEFLTRAVRDTLDSVVSPAVRESLLSEALTLAGEAAIPEETQKFLLFIDTGLRRVLERALGRELGRSVVAELERLIGPLENPGHRSPKRKDSLRARSGRPRAAETRDPRVDDPSDSLPAALGPPTLPAERAPTSEPPATPRVRRSERETDPARMAPTLPPRVRPSVPRPPASADYPSGMAEALGMTQSSSPPGVAAKVTTLPLVFLASRDTELARRFAAWLDPRATVVRVLRLTDLLLALEDAGTRKTALVLDATMPAIRAEAIAALSDELPASLRIILWGGPRELSRQLSASFPRVAAWIVCSERDALSDVVDRCVEAVG